MDPARKDGAGGAEYRRTVGDVKLKDAVPVLEQLLTELLNIDDTCIKRFNAARCQGPEGAFSRECITHLRTTIQSLRIILNMYERDFPELVDRIQVRAFDSMANEHGFSLTRTHGKVRVPGIGAYVFIEASATMEHWKSLCYIPNFRRVTHAREYYTHDTTKALNFADVHALFETRRSIKTAQKRAAKARRRTKDEVTMADVVAQKRRDVHYSNTLTTPEQESASVLVERVLKETPTAAPLDVYKQRGGFYGRMLGTETKTEADHSKKQAKQRAKVQIMWWYKRENTLDRMYLIDPHFVKCANEECDTYLEVPIQKFLRRMPLVCGACGEPVPPQLLGWRGESDDEAGDSD